MVCSIGNPYSLLQDYAEENLQVTDKGITNSYWLGNGAQKLGLKGHVLPDEYQNLYLGLDKFGKPLKQTQKNKGQRTGRDLTFSAPKSVSIAYLVEGKKELLEAHTQAVNKTLQYIEQKCIFTRLGKGGRTKERTNSIVTAVFQHSRSRNYDPNLHSHCVIFNLTQGRDSKWRTMDNQQLYTQSITLGMIYRHHLAQRLQQIGYSLNWNQDGTFDLANYSREQIKHFSSRRKEIIDFAGINSSTKQKAIACVATRNSKQYLTTSKQKEIESSWKRRLDSVDFSQTERGKTPLTPLSKNIPLSKLSTVFGNENRINTLITNAIAIISEKNTSAKFAEHQILKETLIQARGNCDIKQVSVAISSHPELIFTEDGKLTTAKLIEQEKNRQYEDLFQTTITDKVKAILAKPQQNSIDLFSPDNLKFQAFSAEPNRIEALIDRYLKEDSLDKFLTVVDTEEDKHKLFCQIREKLIQENKLTTKTVTPALYPKQLSNEEKLKSEHYQPGDVIKFSRDSKKFKSDRIYKITKVDPQNKMLFLTDRQGSIISMAINRYQNRQLFEVKRRELRNNELLRFSRNHYIKGHQVYAGQLCRIKEIKNLTHIKIEIDKKQIIVNADDLFFTEYGYAMSIDNCKKISSGQINRCIYCPNGNTSRELFHQNLIEVASLTKGSLSVYFEENNLLPQFTNITNKEEFVMDEITKDDNLFEIASSAKYLISTDIQDSQGKVLDIDSFTTIKPSDKGLTVSYENKELKFDKNLKVEKNELSDKQIKDLSHKIKKTKDKTIQENRHKEINRNIGLSL